MKFKFTPSDELQKKNYIETGNRRMPTEIEVDETSLTPEQRKGIVATDELANNGHNSPWRARCIGEMSVSQRTGSVVHGALDFVPTADDAVAMYIAQAGQYPAIRAQQDAYKAEQLQRAAEQKRAAIERAAQREIEAQAARAAKEAEYQDKINAINNVEWDESGKAIIDLLDALFVLSGDEQDSRFNSWAKVVTGVKTTNDNGYDFVGGFVPSGTVEIERKRTVYLVASTSGSRKYQTTTYRVVVLDEFGKFERADIVTDNEKPGWALRIRDDVKALIAP